MLFRFLSAFAIVVEAQGSLMEMRVFLDETMSMRYNLVVFDNITDGCIM